MVNSDKTYQVCTRCYWTVRFHAIWPRPFYTCETFNNLLQVFIWTEDLTAVPGDLRYKALQAASAHCISLIILYASLLLIVFDRSSFLQTPLKLSFSLKLEGGKCKRAEHRDEKWCFAAGQRRQYPLFRRADTQSKQWLEAMINTPAVCKVSRLVILSRIEEMVWSECWDRGLWRVVKDKEKWVLKN